MIRSPMFEDREAIQLVERGGMAARSPSMNCNRVDKRFLRSHQLIASGRSLSEAPLSLSMSVEMKPEITFARLSEIEPDEILAHMSDPRVAEHMPLLTFEWDAAAVTKFIATKEECWVRDGLGHWAILSDGNYVGWGGFQKEGDEWDFGLVLRPDVFGLGTRISRKAIKFAIADERIPFVTFLLPPSRKNLGALERLGARYVDEIEHDGAIFLKYRLETE